MKDVKRIFQLNTSTIHKNAEKVKKIVVDNRRVTASEVAEEISCRFV